MMTEPNNEVRELNDSELDDVAGGFSSLAAAAASLAEAIASSTAPKSTGILGACVKPPMLG
jgi:hypothetical protein